MKTVMLLTARFRPLQCVIFAFSRWMPIGDHGFKRFTFIKRNAAHFISNVKFPQSALMTK